jgi:hypothetical protein
MRTAIGYVVAFILGAACAVSLALWAAEPTAKTGAEIAVEPYSELAWPTRPTVRFTERRGSENSVEVSVERSLDPGESVVR